MASRRKSARPTNKLRQQVQTDDEDYDDDGNDVQTITNASSLASRKESAQGRMVSQLSTQTQMIPSIAVRPGVQAVKASEQMKHLPQNLEPHIALPSDIYQDFEALKSATRLDTTELMRKLLKDYQKMANTSHTPRERKLDDVIGNLVAARSSNILDLSSPRGQGNLFSRTDIGTESISTLGQQYTDDQLAMGVYDEEADNDESDDVKPLDLTLQKLEPAPSPDSAIVEDIHARRQTSPMFPLTVHPYSMVNDDTQTSQSFKPAGSYVINLEPSNDVPSVLNSTLARALQMDIPLQNINKVQNYTLGSPETLIMKDPSTTMPNLRKAISGQSTASIRNPSQLDTILGTKTMSSVEKMQDSAKLSRDSPLSVLPSYTEALTSVYNTHQNINMLRQDKLANEPSSGGTAPNIPQDCQTSAVSFVQISAEDADIKFIPLNISPQFLTASTSSQHQQVHQQLHFSQQNILQQQSKSENKQHSVPVSQLGQQTSSPKPNQNQNALSSICTSQLSHVQMLPLPSIKTEISEQQENLQAIRCSEASYPNFLLEPQSIALSSLNTSGSSTSVSMPMSTFFMTASTSGGVGNMVAIPVIHTLPEGMTGLQPIAFAPHPVIPQTSTSSVTSAPSSSDMILATATTAAAASAANSVKPAVVPLNQSHVNPGSSSYTPDNESTPSMSLVKPKPGRPRGRGGRGQSQKTQNKDMKLLTENTLFPGVYTSILKLPWSRRSRNKPKSKTISELKKQAQIIANEKVNEKEDHFIGETNQQKNETVVDPDFTDDVYQNKNVCTMPENMNTIKNEHVQQHTQQQQHVLQQKQKDLEQQQRLHMQYHMRLQEEQRKLTKQIEQSYLNVSGASTVPASIALSTHAVLPIKQEIITSEYSDETAPSLSFPITTSDSHENLLANQHLLSKEPIMMVYSNADASSPRKPRKRGRPPKVPSLPTSVYENQTSFDSTICDIKQQLQEPDNFLQARVTMTAVTEPPTVANARLETSSHSQVPGNSEQLMVVTQGSEEMDVDRDPEMTLEKKITFLTNQIGIEMSKTMISQVTTREGNSNIHQNNDANDNLNTDGSVSQNVQGDTSKSLVDVKPRRKKVSRLLKSDENFMYATFKIKPRGLTPRKSRRKRNKDVLASTAAAAETIANLRQKTLQDCLSSSSSDNTRSSMVAWKFHEQYPIASEEAQGRKIACVTCGHFFIQETESMEQQQCESCLISSEHSVIGDSSQTVKTGGCKAELDHSELKAECCVTCGSIFQKHYSDPSALCDSCRNSTSTAIRSSKLFSFQDSPPQPSSTPLSMSGTTMSSSFTSPFPVLSTRDSKHRDTGITKINNNHLFCSLCRMEFTKICDYLTHIRENHEVKSDNKSPLLGESATPNDLGRKTKVSKTKKSLAHKTLTCPIEECPHFFREKKDLDLHILKKHPTMSICPQSDCGFSYSTMEELESHFSYDHGLSVIPATSLALTLTTVSDEGQHGGEETSGSNSKNGSASEKPLQCEFCDYRCRQKNALTWHMRKHPEAASQHRRYSSVGLD